jgi:hypothetical protein
LSAALEKVNVASDKNSKFELSCSLCGDIFEIMHKTFLELRTKGKEDYCSSCVLRLKETVLTICKLPTCKKEFPYVPYWYLMKGMECPKTCTSCKKEASEIEKISF